MEKKFNIKYHKKFIKYFNIKKNPGKWDILYTKKAKKYINAIKWIPGIRMVGIGNSISMNCSNKNSDIDLYIVSTNNSMWVNRIFITFIFTILGVRKTKNKHAGKFCLSFFSTIDGMNFSNFRLKNDIYLYFWLFYFKPILNYNNTYELLLEINGIKKSNIDFIKKNNKSNKFIGFINKILKKIFLKKTSNNYKKLKKPFGVIINNNLLKFHNKDIRKKIKDIF